MNKRTLITATACLIGGVALVVPLASAFANDASYCAALSANYRKYVGSVQTDAKASVAMSQCSAGNTAAGIPTLEKFLEDAKVTVPPRT
jgi:hypothetical protein